MSLKKHVRSTLTSCCVVELIKKEDNWLECFGKIFIKNELALCSVVEVIEKEQKEIINIFLNVYLKYTYFLLRCLVDRNNDNWIEQCFRENLLEIYLQTVVLLCSLKKKRISLKYL